MLNRSKPSLQTPSVKPRLLKLPALLAVLAASASMAACARIDRTATVATHMPETVEERHPIALAETPVSIDIFHAGQSFEKSQQLRVKQFGAMYRETGKGPITVLLPSGKGRAGAESALSGIRGALASAGVGGHIQVGSYQPDNANLAAPVRLSFVAVQARVASRCGQWPDDLGSASSLEGWQNKQYWNFGCSHQNMFAQQVADPRDMASPRGETQADVNMRMRAIGNVRKGNDPGTKWQVKNANIGGLGN